jgi:hypothetical protein
MENFPDPYIDYSPIRKKSPKYIYVNFENENLFKKAMKIFDEFFIRYNPIYSRNSLELQKTPNVNSFIKLLDREKIPYKILEST